MSLDGFYLNRHRTQYDGIYADQTFGCTWTAVANGADAASGGAIDRSPSQVHALIARADESDPSTPGWSIVDADKAAARLGLGFENRTGQGWAGVSSALAAGLYVVIQGDSDRFGDATCSGAFNGDHCVGIHPATRYSGSQHWIDDGICPTGRWESNSILRAYAEKLSTSVRFGVFTRPVPKALAPIPSTVPHVVTSAPTPSERNAMIAQGGLTVTSSHVQRLASGQPLFRYPGGPRVTATSAAGPVAYVGSAGSGWRAVQVKTRGVYADGIARPTVLYVPAAAGPVEKR